jgi:hypothetical protein
MNSGLVFPDRDAEQRLTMNILKRSASPVHHFVEDSQIGSK